MTYEKLCWIIQIFFTPPQPLLLHLPRMFRYIKMWDTETGQVCGRFSNKKMAFCAKFNPNDALQHLIVAGTSSNKIVCWDTR